ncbi:MAG: SpaA isopeptide-forming pilin-related protein, partial [Thomasclavelia ramosa]|nr:SpaA isopeptide-forming pilin-related protein [Thomasclavelia ramosa]
MVVTDKNGKANTSYLPYGTYLVRETKTPADYITAPDFTVSVTKDYTEFDDVEQVKRINVNNRPFTSQLKLVKKDKETGKTVTLNSASFRIKDANGNYVTQKVSGKKYDTFTTNSKNQVVVFDGNNGEVFLPLSLDAGTYSVEEVKVPEGFLELESPVTFTITNTRNYDVDGDEDPIVTVQVKNDR